MLLLQFVELASIRRSQPAAHHLYERGEGCCPAPCKGQGEVLNASRHSRRWLQQAMAPRQAGGQGRPWYSSGGSGGSSGLQPWNELCRGNDLGNFSRPHVHYASLEGVHREHQAPGARWRAGAACRQVGGASSVVVAVARCVIGQENSLAKSILRAVSGGGPKACSGSYTRASSAPCLRHASPDPPRPSIAAGSTAHLERGPAGHMAVLHCLDRWPDSLPPPPAPPQCPPLGPTRRLEQRQGARS